MPASRLPETAAVTSWPERTAHPTLDRLVRRSRHSRRRIRGRNPYLLVAAAVRRFSEVRATGLAAEMAYYLVLSLIPLVTAVGASLGFLATVLPATDVQAIREGAASAVELVLGQELAAQVAVPLLDELLGRDQVALAVGGAVAALFLGSRVLRSVVAALGEAVQIPERRGFWRLWGLAVALTLLAVVTVTVVLGLIVIGPLFGGGQAVAEAVGAGSAFRWVWSLGRWPVTLAILWAFLVLLYRLGQRARGWRRVMPGAVLATGGLVLLASGFRLYLDIAPPGGRTLSSGQGAASAASLFLTTALAVLLFGWLAGLVVLAGGIFNAEWSASAPRATDDIVPSASEEDEHKAFGGGAAGSDVSRGLAEASLEKHLR